jgi:hypothetical protein
MATFDTQQLVDALSLPLGELIASVGRGVAEAQREMDAASISVLQEIYSRGDGLFVELQRIGYRPTWYHIPEAEGDLQITLTATSEQTSGSAAATPGSSRIKLYAAPVDAAYASRFGFNVQASSRVKFRIVPVPPSTAADSLQVVPLLVGMTVEAARARLDALNITGTFPAGAEAGATVKTQSPAANQLLLAGQSVIVEIE